MNFKLTAAVAAIIGLGAAQAAVAADLPARPVYKAPAAMPMIYNWSGIYIGGHIGGGWSNVDVGDPTGFVTTVPAAASAWTAAGSSAAARSAPTGSGAAWFWVCRRTFPRRT
ncbi:MAG: hypothetical protein J0H89_11605 [Rhizobiales bacterium]|nr:hypothetical protein [Hyphomicrobiales bacterium]